MPGPGSCLDPYVDDIVRMLEENPKVPATVILEHLRPLGYGGGISVLKQRVAKLRPVLRAARSYQRTSYLPGEIGQLDWWHSGVEIPVGKGPGVRPSDWSRRCCTRPHTPRCSPSDARRRSSVLRSSDASSASGASPLRRDSPRAACH